MVDVFKSKQERDALLLEARRLELESKNRLVSRGRRGSRPPLAVEDEYLNDYRSGPCRSVQYAGLLINIASTLLALMVHGGGMTTPM